MDDIAAVAAAALLDDDHRGKAYLLTGPEALTRTELVAHIGAALGREIEFVRATPEETVEALTPVMRENAQWYVDNVLATFETTTAAPNHLVEEVSGRPATRFADWARAHSAEFS